MAIVKERCWSCGSEISVKVGQAVYDRELVWHKGYSCPYCSFNAEEDGQGPPPDEIRFAILQQEGIWGLNIEEPGLRITEALKLLRQALNFSLGEIGELRRRIPGTVIKGTRAEMERLLSILLIEGLPASVTRLPETVCPQVQGPN